MSERPSDRRKRERDVRRAHRHAVRRAQARIVAKDELTPPPEPMRSQSRPSSGAEDYRRIWRRVIKRHREERQAKQVARAAR